MINSNYQSDKPRQPVHSLAHSHDLEGLLHSLLLLPHQRYYGYQKEREKRVHQHAHQHARQELRKHGAEFHRVLLERDVAGWELELRQIGFLQLQADEGLVDSVLQGDEPVLEVRA